jgi:hypothetical protein
LHTPVLGEGQGCSALLQPKPTTETHMNKPSHIAYVVTETGTGRDKKAFWREVGSVWPHKNGGGFDLLIHDQLAVSGRIIITERKDRAAAEQAD